MYSGCPEPDVLHAGHEDAVRGREGLVRRYVLSLVYALITYS